MPTSLHIPETLLKAVDRKARLLGISRNRLILRALERELAPEAGWSPGFFETLADVDRDTAEAAAELERTVLRARKSKPPVQF